MKKIIAIIAFAALPALLTGCGDKDDTFIDKRDGKKYKTVKIDNQTWMAENLNNETPNRKCYDNDPSNCAKYGRLYTWDEAMVACPSGWRLPSDDDWTELRTVVEGGGGNINAGKILKSFEEADDWWSATQATELDESDNVRWVAYIWGITDDGNLSRGFVPLDYLNSVRCVKD